MGQVGPLVTEGGRLPSRRTFERRWGRLPETLPAQLACPGQQLLTLIQPWTTCGRAVAIDRTPLHAFKGAVWHQRDREAGRVPHSAIDTEAHWTKSGWHGWVSGWKLQLVTTVAALRVPLAAYLTPANVADNEPATTRLPAMPDQARFILGDSQYWDGALREQAASQDWLRLAARRGGSYPRTDDGVEVRRRFHALRHHAIEPFIGQFRAIFDVGRPVPTRDVRATRRSVLGAVFVYHLPRCTATRRGPICWTGSSPSSKPPADV
jgi:hypothetical protein